VSQQNNYGSSYNRAGRSGRLQSSNIRSISSGYTNNTDSSGYSNNSANQEGQTGTRSR
jgi:hypothetical protein